MSKNHKVLPFATGIVQDYGNCLTDFIADKLSPRVKVARREFVHREFDNARPYNTPPQAAMVVGDYAQVIEVEANKSDLVADFTIDRGLENPIDWHSFNESGQPCSNLDIDVTGRHGTYLMHKLMLDRELRAAENVQKVANYTIGNALNLSGAVIGDGSSSTIDPLDMITQAMELATVQPNTIVMSYKTWMTIRRQNSINGNVNARDLASVQRFSDVFEFDNVLIGKPMVNNGSGVRVPVWASDKIVLAYVDPSKDNPECPRASFSWTATVDGAPMLRAWDDETIGLRGGVRVRVGEGTKEKWFYNQGVIIHNFALSAS